MGSIDFDVRTAKELRKPAKGSYRRKQVATSLKRKNKEDSAKVAAKKRDGYRCRWPHTDPVDRELCRRSSWKEAMHWKAKGIGGNRDGSRNTRRNIITGCSGVHQGPGSLHAGGKRIVPLTPEKMDGPCAFEEKVKGKWTEVGREISVGVLARP